ncbi:MAG: flippase [Calditrichaeota bacterium]|nr:flippase [Calditrichota bacterium]
MLRNIFKNISVLLVTRIVAQFLAFLTTLYISRKIGVEGFGKIGYVTSILIYLDMLSNLGLENYSVREVSRFPGRINFFISHVITLRILTSSVIYFILLILGVFVFHFTDIYLLLLIYAISLLLKGLALTWTFQALSKMEFLGLGQIIMQGIYLFTIFVFVKSPSDILFVPVAFNIGFLVLVLYTWTVHYRRIPHITFRINIKRWVQMLRISLPIILAYIVLRINWNVGLLILGTLGRATSAGLFNAALKILVLLITFREILITVHYPLMSRYFNESFEKLRQIMEFFIKISVTVALPIAIGGIIFRKELILLLFQEKYIKAADPLLFLLIGYAFMMINIVFPAGQNAFNRQNIYLKTSLQIAGISIFLNIIFIPLLGATGAALSMAISEFFSLLLFRWRSFQVIKIKDIKLLTQLIPSLTLMILVGKLLGDIFILYKVGITAVIYLISLFVFRVINKNEINFIKSLFKF